MNKYDLIPTSAAVIVALVWFITNLMISSNGNMAYIYLDNKLIETCPLNENKNGSIVCNDKDILCYTVENGTIDVTFAACDDKLCVHQKPISKNGENIVCLPQKIVISIDSEKNNEFDGFTD